MHGYHMPTSHCSKSDKLSITVMKDEHKRKFGNLNNVKKKKPEQKLTWVHYIIDFICTFKKYEVLCFKNKSFYSWEDPELTYCFF